MEVAQSALKLVQPTIDILYPGLPPAEDQGGETEDDGELLPHTHGLGHPPGNCQHRDSSVM